MRLTMLLATAASAAIGMTALAAPVSQPIKSQQVLHAHSIPIEASRAALTDAGSFTQVLLGDIVEMSITLQDGTPVDLELERFSPFAPNARIVSVDADGVEHGIDLSGDVHLRGHVAGDESQIVYIAVTPFGTSGLLEFGRDTHIISAGKFDGQAKAVSDLAVFPANMLGITPLGQNCAVDMNNPEFNPLALQIADDFIGFDGQQAPLGMPQQRDAGIAVETDYEFSAWLFGGNTTASASYASSLLAAISTIYDRDMNMTLSISFLRTYAANNDPYGGSSIIDFLDDVQLEFNTGAEADIDRVAVQGLSARGLGGGVAYLATACSDWWGIGVSANLDGFFPNPLQDNSHNNWDIMVCAHEMGHNFGTGHTHDSYTPAIDNCGNGDCSQALDSTIMSYCHICPGGLSNLDLRFHSRVQDRMLSYLDNDAACDLFVTECAVDLNSDGSVDFFDISAFLTELAAGSSVADWNGDGSVDFFDISGFLVSYGAGCP
ncbi:MAG: hypothetical protein JKY43_11845 [Phycisphaerales bacterium]|nr:hypothetical protein [Phycisphaerales bacterium]